MRRPLSDFPVVELAGGFHAVVVRDWRSAINESTIRWLGKPLRPDRENLWILTTTAEDAATLSKLAQRDFLPEDIVQPRERYVTTRRQPSFAEALALVPDDVACYLSGTAAVDDHGLIQRRYPAPARVNESIRWSGGKYHVSSGHGFFRREIGPAPTTFAATLCAVRDELLAEVGPGFDQTLDHLNASPILAAMLGTLTRPAAEAVSHWMGQLGMRELEVLTIPARGLCTDLPIDCLKIESKGVGLHASFFMTMGDIRVTEMEVCGLLLSDTLGTGLAEMAGRDELMLDQVVDLPGGDLVRVLSMTRHASSWSARIDPVSVRIRPPVSDIPFDADDEIARIQQEGNEVCGDAMLALAGMARERAAFVLYCVEDGSSGMDFDITPWTPPGVTAEVQLRNRLFVLGSSHHAAPLSFLKDLP